MNEAAFPIYQIGQIRRIEALAEKEGCSGEQLMQRAGKAAFELMRARFPGQENIICVCGSGNNGGDGYVLARLAKEAGLAVRVIHVGEAGKMQGAALAARKAAEGTGIPISSLHDASKLPPCDLVIDAVCGIGVTEPLHGEPLLAVQQMAQSSAPILAIDIPSGINANTGEILGAAPSAAATITFLGLKLGLLTGAGIACAGEVAVDLLDIPPFIYDEVQPVAERLSLSSFMNYLKPRPRDWHKGLSGHLLIVGGDEGYSGAPRMAAMAALRTGAGLVSVATHPANAAMMNAACPEIMCHAISRPDQLIPLMQRADCIVLGPGLGQTEWSHQLWDRAVRTTGPLLIDADGLNLLAQQPHQQNNWVLTPHPGEAARLLQKPTGAVQRDRLTALHALIKRYGGVIALKGAGTLVGSANSMAGVCDAGNPGMATAGMGDILSGVIGSLIVQQVPLADAAKLGVLLHALAGDLEAEEGERGMMATDLLPFLRYLSNVRGQ
jgi:ADP-dependent NAD(P)H-hydrate dehydratase / NAD(P)H-hydrate epimerase